MGRFKSTSERARRAHWRDPLFYWRGAVSPSGAWQGSWIASEAGLPSDDAFSASTNTFQLQSAIPLAPPAPGGQSTDFTGSYLLDNGDGPNSYSDFEHSIHWTSALVAGVSPSFLESRFATLVEYHQWLKTQQAESWCLVTASGNSEFGRFISAGRLEFAQAPARPTLKFARRYVANKDPRTKRTAAELVEECIHAEEPYSPWTVLRCE